MVASIITIPIKKIDIRITGPLIKLDIEADGFLWNMVRKIVTALKMVGSGVRDTEWIKQMLNPATYEEGIQSAHPYGLTLMSVNFPNKIDWKVDTYSVRKATELFKEKQLYNRVMSEVYENLIPSNET